MYPTDIYSPREKLNKPGEIYAPDNPYKLFAEDLTNLDDNVVAIENEIEDTVKPAIANAGHTDAEIVDLIYPVGSIYIGVGSTSPATLFGGTWEAFGAGKVLVGKNSSDTDFDTVEETGGEKTHTLITAEIPAHKHTIQGGKAPLYDVGSADANFGWHIQSVSGYRANGGTMDNTGGGRAHNNLQPYIVVNMWKRTA